MKKHVIFLLTILVSLSSFAKEEKRLTPWEQQSEFQKVKSISLLRDFLTTYSKEKQTLKDGDVCFSYGWVSVVKDNKCLLPDTSSKSYTDYLPCGDKKILCQPLVYGDQVCVHKTNNHLLDCLAESDRVNGDFESMLALNATREMNEVLSKVDSFCESNSRGSCVQFRNEVINFLDVLPRKTKILPKKTDDIVSKQNEFEKFLIEFDRDCSTMKKGSEQRCKNLALKFNALQSELKSLISRAQNQSSQDCYNCSLDNSKKKITIASFSADEILKRTCDETDRKKRFNDCDEDFFCALKSTVLTPVPLLKEIFSSSDDKCLASQNSCLTNFVSSVIKSLTTLVTGVWDLIKMGVDWSGEKISSFWKDVTSAEEATSDAHFLARSLDENSKKQIQESPESWMSLVMSNIWKGLKVWVREDVFCEKWAGVPRASKCLEPSKGFDCLGCREIINGTCSIGGVVIGELMPAFITGGLVNVAARSKGSVEAISKFISSHPASKKVQSLSEVQGIKQVLNGAKQSGIVVKESAKSMGDAFLKLSKTESYKKMEKVASVAMKYTGLKAISDANVGFYQLGSKTVDHLFSPQATKVKVTGIELTRAVPKDEILKTEISQMELSKELKEKLMTQVGVAITKGQELRAIKEQIRQIYAGSMTPDDLTKLAKLEVEASYLHREVNQMNDSFLEKLHELYQTKKIPSRLTTSENGSLILNIDPYPINQGNKAHRYISSLQTRFEIDSITISLADNSYYGTRGFFSSASSRLDLGYAQALKLADGSISTVTKHEYRHGMFYAMRNKNISSEYHVSFRAAKDTKGGKPIHDGTAYDRYMSAEELYNLSVDFKTMSKLFPKVDLKNLEAVSLFLDQIEQHYNLLTDVSRGVKGMTEKGEEWIIKALENPSQFDLMDIEVGSNGIKHVKIYDDSFREIETAFVTPEEIEKVSQYKKQRSAYINRKNQLLTQELEKRNIDVQEMFKRFPGNLTDEERNLLKELRQKISGDPSMKSSLEDMHRSSVPMLKVMKDKFDALNRSSTILIDDLDDLSFRLEDLRRGKVSPEKMEELRERMILISRRVKNHTNPKFKYAEMKNP